MKKETKKKRNLDADVSPVSQDEIDALIKSGISSSAEDPTKPETNHVRKNTRLNQEQKTPVPQEEVDGITEFRSYRCCRKVGE